MGGIQRPTGNHDMDMRVIIQRPAMGVEYRRRTQLTLKLRVVQASRWWAKASARSWAGRVTVTR